MSNIEQLPNYLCPLCQSALIATTSGFKCQHNHQFDRAKEGYVNLLPVQFKHSKDPGDNKAMVKARRDFLAQGYYDELRRFITKQYMNVAQSGDTLLDAGCGEGFYSHQLKSPINTVYGVDIAKEAVKLAAKKYKQCHFSVASVFQLPFDNNYFNWVTSIYAPLDSQEIHRVMANKGYLLRVLPGKDHLSQLKSEIYRTPSQHDVERELLPNLTLVEQLDLNYEMTLKTGPDIVNLLSMTPFAYKLTPDISAKLTLMTQFTCTADFHVRLYQKAN